MTVRQNGKKLKKSLPSSRGIGLCYVCLFLVIIFFKNASAASLWVSQGLRVCALGLIPSLFPFMVLSSLLLSLGTGRLIPKAVRRTFKAVFGVGSEGTSAIILGWACGFPVGAKCACELASSGRIDDSEYKKIVMISSTPSPAFLIGAVGRGMLGSVSVGASLYVLSLVSSIAVGIFLGRAFKSHSNDDPRSQRRTVPKLSDALTRAVSQSALGMLNICAFVIFFCAFLGVLEGILRPLGISDTATSVIFTVFELTTGLARITSQASPLTLPLCAFAVGWSGLSVHLQTLSVCASHPIGVRSLLVTHAVRALFCFLLAMLIL